MSETLSSKDLRQQTQKLEAKELVKQIQGHVPEAEDPDDGDADCNVGDEKVEHETSQREVVGRKLVKSNQNNLAAKGSSSALNNIPVPDLDERPQGAEYNTQIASFNQNTTKQPGPPIPFSIPKDFGRTGGHPLPPVKTEEPDRRPRKKEPSPGESRSKSQKPPGKDGRRPVAELKKQDYDRLLATGGLNDPIDVNLSIAKDECCKTSEDGAKADLHKTRLKNAELRLAIENAKKERDNLSKEIEKIKANIAKAEKVRESDTAYMTKQEEELTKIKAQIKKLQQSIKEKTQEYQRLQKQLTTAMSVKEKYETIIKKVLENPAAHELVKTLFKGTTELDFINLIMSQK